MGQLGYAQGLPLVPAALPAAPVIEEVPGTCCIWDPSVFTHVLLPFSSHCEGQSQNSVLRAPFPPLRLANFQRMARPTPNNSSKKCAMLLGRPVQLLVLGTA
jgi:hypothetical protein